MLKKLYEYQNTTILGKTDFFKRKIIDARNAARRGISDPNKSGAVKTKVACFPESYDRLRATS
jgi:hypothetical protein